MLYVYCNMSNEFLQCVLYFASYLNKRRATCKPHNRGKTLHLEKKATRRQVSLLGTCNHFSVPLIVKFGGYIKPKCTVDLPESVGNKKWRSFFFLFSRY
jgi:hypothetical protein